MKNPKPVKLFNTMSREVETLQPITQNQVNVYCCGPTVYNYQHIGNLRTYIFEDLLVKTLRYAGYAVTHVMNITDVGHLASDADEGEDKMLLAAKREGKTSWEIADFYADIFFKDCAKLHIQRPDVVCKATDHIQQMIELIKRLEEKGVAYQAGGNVYFDVSKFKEYGKLARLNLEQLQAGARIDVDSNKRSPADFALWFTKSKFEKQEMQWDSPWGVGYPGWHIECSAMSMHHLGESFDIHCGGIDHIPVHHTNEIAQSEAATGKTFSKIWMHGGFLIDKEKKMSKSTGDFLTLDRLVEKGFDPMSYRLLCLGGTYRNELSWSWEALESAENSLKRIKSAVVNFKSISNASAEKSPNFEKTLLEFEEALLNDLAFPKALAVLYSVIDSDTLTPAEKLELLYSFDEVLSLGIKSWEAEEVKVPDQVAELVQKRIEARQNKNWALSDELRDIIFSLGFIVEDSKTGSVIKKR